MQKSKVFQVGLAIFAMLFGAGNVVFPLGLGRDVGDKVFFALIGLMISAILVPIIGLVSAMLYDGNYKKFLGTIGSAPGAIIAFICMVLIGPFGATPRCLTIAHAVVKWYVPQFSIILFSLISCVFIFICTIRKNFVVELMGKFLGPIKLTLLLSIIVLGILYPATPIVVDLPPLKSFLVGLHEGYWTLDLLGVVFFAGLVINAVKKQAREENLSSKEVAMIGLQGGIIGGLLLGVVYGGFCIVASMYSGQLASVAQDQILSALAISILGPKAGILANVTMAVACLTTALALTTVFADYLQKEIFKRQISYLFALVITISCTFAMANLGFAKIMNTIKPVVSICYPALIVLAVVNALHKIFGYKYIKTPVFATFAITVLMNFW